MFRLEGYRIGDPWFFVEDGTTHMWFLTQTADSPPKTRGRDWDIGYAVSTDLVNWDYRGIALKRGWGDAWDSQKLATGSVMKRDGVYWMSYTGHRRHWLSVQRAGLAWSVDLEHWNRLDENPVTEAVLPWYDLGQRDEPPVYCYWRDPFLVEDGPLVYQLLCAVEADAPADTRGVVGRARSRDMHHWEVMEPLETDRMAREMECPIMHHIDGRWYLLFSSHAHMISDEMKARFPEHRFRSDVYSMVSDHQWGPYHIHGTGVVQPADAPAHVYAGQLVFWNGQWYILGFLFDENDKPAEAISDPIPVKATPEGIRQMPS